MAEFRLNRRQLLSRGGLGVVGAALPSCSPVDALAGGARDRVTIGTPLDLQTLDPHMTLSAGSGLSMLSHIYLALVSMSANGQVVPEAATRWETLSDTVWRFHLREGLSFANGEPLDSAVVVWNFARIQNKAARARVALWFSSVDRAVAVDQRTVDIHLSKPYPVLIRQLAAFLLLPPRWASATDPARSTMPSGPYRIAQLIPGDRIILAARSVTQPMPPRFAQVVFRVLPNEDSRIAALRTGEIDFAGDLLPQATQLLRGMRGISVGAVDSIRTMIVKYNMERRLLGRSALVRRALSMAIDRQAVIDAMWYGHGRIANQQLLTPVYFGYNPALTPTPYDPAAARRLLRSGNFRPGELKLTLEVPVGAYLQAEDICQVIAAQIEEIGIKVTLAEFPFANWMARYLKTHEMGDTAFLAQGSPTLDADRVLSLFEKGSPYAYWDDEEFSRIVRIARSTNDPAQRQRLYALATCRMARLAPVLFLFTPPYTYAHSTKLRWTPRGDDYVRALDMRIA